MGNIPRSVSLCHRMPPNHGDSNFGSENDGGKHFPIDLAGIGARVNTFGRFPRCVTFPSILTARHSRPTR